MQSSWPKESFNRSDLKCHISFEVFEGVDNSGEKTQYTIRKETLVRAKHSQDMKNFCIRELLYQKTTISGNLHIGNLPEISISENVYIRDFLYRKLPYQTNSIPEDFYARKLLYQKTSTSENFYIRNFDIKRL